MQAQRERRWLQENNGYDDLTGKTLGIAGLGRIGEALVTRARGFGVRILATKRDVSHRYDPSVEIDRIYPPEALPEMLRGIGSCLHHDASYQRDESSVRRSNAGAHETLGLFVQYLRGKIIDEPALIDALRNGRLQGAALDVFESEPLPSDSPLWAMDNVIVTPHVAGFNPHYFIRAADLFAENLRHYFQGEPLNNAYDSRRGY